MYTLDSNKFGCFADMRHWVLQSYGLLEEAASAEQRHTRWSPHFTLVDRGPAASRRILNQDEVANAAQKYGKVQVVKLQDLSFEQQLQLMLDTDILIAAHGSGAALMMFLPPQGVSVELRAYKHGLTGDFTHGNSNLARATNTSMLIWNNRHAQHAQRWEATPDWADDFKNQHTFVTKESIELILKAAVQTWQVPVSDRNYNKIMHLNSAEPLT